MRIRGSSLGMLGGVMLLAAPVGSAAQEGGDPAREAEVRAVVAGFHAALASADSLGALGYLQRDVVVYESGHAESLDEYRAGHLPADIAFVSATRRTVTESDVALFGDAALYTSETHTTGSWRGRDIDAHGTETILLVHAPDGWRIRHIHWSSR